MSRQIFVNLAVSDIQRSRQFFTALGFSINEQFSNEVAVCVVIADNIFAMLLKPEFYSQFTSKSLCDAQTSSEVLLCLSCSSRTEVDTIGQAAEDNGGRIARPGQDQGPMYGLAFEDPDGHTWELMYMEMPNS
ncbi:VOC family protein [Thalassolituus hydrocarboniclasticus]|uniref:Glyoxalase/bleomycin resistance/extradiol dioxygenase family protein n=1 Tax=Thalassolituus hydrocarboniclasticus TaxID=2742796 RepID=A0ABY6A854_9GAMM|nr:VOC family protein [Thalassolituus hydrocarboniclasticus]UXD86765.1 glyoxalase/bleomycin resistance/extradiol dioxygenase family protein [Thalassolituus hydrocarboniclasticus]